MFVTSLCWKQDCGLAIDINHYGSSSVATTTRETKHPKPRKWLMAELIPLKKWVIQIWN